MIGARLRRKEDPRLLRGGRFVADLARHGMLHATLLRSPHARARIARIDVPAGVTAFTHADLGAALRPIPIRIGARPGQERFLQFPLAPGEVRYVGEPVAVVVAGSRYAAEDACERIRVSYEQLPPDDDVFERFSVDVGDVDAVFDAADVVVRGRFKTNRHFGCPLETRGLLAEWDAGREEMTVWGPTKVVHFNRAVLADMLSLPLERVRLVEPDVGGGFGTKGEFYPEDFLIPYLARRLGRPVRWIEDRREHMVAANHSREQSHTAELAATADGRLLGLRGRLDCDMGAYLRTHGVAVPELTAALLAGPYDLRHYRYEVCCRRSCKTPTGTYRGPGRYEACFVREGLIDRLAARLGLDPAEVRRRNLIRPQQMPYDRGTQALGGVPTLLDGGDYPGLLERALERFGYGELRAEQAAGRRIGLGLACFVEKSGLGPWEAASVEIDPQGGVTVASGGAALGQGLETALAQVCAEALGVPYDTVEVRHGDTALVPFGTGSWASRQTTLGGCAVAQAAEAVRRQALAVAAGLLEARPEDLRLEPGAVRVAGTDRSLALADVARACRPPDGAGLRSTAIYRAERMSYPFGLHLALVEADRETGEVRLVRYLVAYDVGRAVNPTLVEGQLAGGWAQGIGGTLMEELVYDGAGQFLSGSLADYLLPGAADLPRLETLVDECPTRVNPLGVKGAGEGGLVGAPGALANALADLAGEGVAELPLSPERVWRLFSPGLQGRAAGVEKQGLLSPIRGLHSMAMEVDGA